MRFLKFFLLISMFFTACKTYTQGTLKNSDDIHYNLQVSTDVVGDWRVCPEFEGNLYLIDAHTKVVGIFYSKKDNRAIYKIVGTYFQETKQVQAEIVDFNETVGIFTGTLNLKDGKGSWHTGVCDGEWKAKVE